MSDAAADHVNIIRPIRNTDDFMRLSFHGSMAVAESDADPTGEQASPVRGEPACSGCFAGRMVSRTRDYNVADDRRLADPVSPTNRNASETTGPARPAGNRGELYGGYSLV